MELYPGFIEQRKGGSGTQMPQSISFLTSTTKNKINETNLRKRQLRLLEVAVSMSLGFLQSGRHSFALQAAEQYLVLAADLYSVNDLNLIPPYCLLAEICIGLNKLAKAEQYLQKANWVVQRNQDDENINAVNSRLYRAFGLVQAAKGNNDEARRLFAEQVYYSSLVAGTESIQAANGYYNLANVWSREQANKQHALSLYGKAIECWFAIIMEETLELSEAEIGETKNMLTTTAEVLNSSCPDSVDAPRARALLTAYLSRMKFSNATEEREKTLQLISEKTVDDSLIQTLLKI